MRFAVFNAVSLIRKVEKSLSTLMTAIFLRNKVASSQQKTEINVYCNRLPAHGNQKCRIPDIPVLDVPDTWCSVPRNSMAELVR